MHVREPAVAGTFYDNGQKNLKVRLDHLFSNTETKVKYRMVVSPHAGYVYSGRTAAFAVSSLKKAKKFIILGPNHTGLGQEFSLMSSGEWFTPLGECKIDGKLAEKLKALDFMKDDIMAHDQEHSIEVQLPFIQHKFGDDFTFVPVCIMNTTYSDGFLNQCRMLGRRIAFIMRNDPEVAVIASSDFSHYLTQKEADEKDSAAIDRIESLDVRGFFETLEKVEGSVCGFGPIAAVMEAAEQNKLRPKVIHKSSSGDATGDYSQVVAYYAIGFG